MNLFTNDLHEYLFEQRREEVDIERQNEPGTLSCLYLMTSGAELFAKMNPYFRTDEFYYIDMLREKEFSGSCLTLVTLAIHLYKYSVQKFPLEMTTTLDSKLVQLAMNAIHIRRTGAIYND